MKYLKKHNNDKKETIQIALPEIAKIVCIIVFKHFETQFFLQI